MAIVYARNERAQSQPISLTFLLATAVVLLIASLSPSALIYFGVNYVLPGGSPLQKIHPATYLAVASVALVYVFGQADRIHRIVFVESPQLLYFTLSLCGLAFYSTALKEVPFSGTIDTFLPVILLFILISLLTFYQKGLLGRVLDIFLLGNSLLGIFEVGTNWRMVPIGVSSLVLGQILYPYEWRASAFLGHPLTNSYVTGCYALSLLVTNRIPSLYIRIPLFLVHFVALFAFGSRGATVFLLCMIALFVARHALIGMFSGRMNKAAGAFLVAFVPVLFIGTPVFLGSGFADRFIDRFVNDKGSAETRMSAIEMMTSYSFTGLLFGPSELDQARMATRYGTAYGVESFYLTYLFRFGVLGCLIFFPFLFIFAQEIARRGGPGTGLILIYFFICCGTSVSIGSKNLCFAIVMAICLTSRNRAPAAPPIAPQLRRP